MVSNGLPLPNSAPWIRFSNSVSSKLGSWMVRLPGPASPVTTTVPRLRTAANAAATTSSVTTPTVISAWSAPTPRVSSVTSSCAVAASAAVWVAPNSMACSRLNSSGSTAMTYRAPANAAPCTALMPTPPIPYTTVVSPGRTPPAFTAVPQPVGTPQPASATVSSGRSSSILMQECSDTTERWENVPSRHIWPKSWPSAWNRNVPSGRQLSTNSAPRSHRFVMPWAQNRQCPQVGRNEQTTWSPGLSRLTPAPTSSTTPAPSWPPTIGYRTGMSPVRRWSSEWHRPAAANRISTSPSRGGSRSSSMTSQSLPMSLSTAALVFMRPPARYAPPPSSARAAPLVTVPGPKTPVPVLASRADLLAGLRPLTPP